MVLTARTSFGGSLIRLTAMSFALAVCSIAVQMPVGRAADGALHRVVMLGDSKCVVVNETVRCAPVVLPAE